MGSEYKSSCPLPASPLLLLHPRPPAYLPVLTRGFLPCSGSTWFFLPQGLWPCQPSLSECSPPRSPMAAGHALVSALTSPQRGLSSTPPRVASPTWVSDRHWPLATQHTWPSLALVGNCPPRRAVVLPSLACSVPGSLLFNVSSRGREPRPPCCWQNPSAVSQPTGPQQGRANCDRSEHLIQKPVSFLWLLSQAVQGQKRACLFRHAYAFYSLSSALNTSIDLICLWYVSSLPFP